jgi:hypothetical protein
MPHEIATTDGKPSIAFYGDLPWHGLGTRIDAPATAARFLRRRTRWLRILPAEP